MPLRMYKYRLYPSKKQIKKSGKETKRLKQEIENMEGQIMKNKQYVNKLLNLKEKKSEL